MSKLKKQFNWIPRNDLIYGYRAIRYSGTGELGLASKRGEIWVYSETMLSCVVFHPIAASRVARLLQQGDFTPLRRGDEIIFRFPTELLDDVVKILKIPKTRPAQCRAANTNCL